MQVHAVATVLGGKIDPTRTSQNVKSYDAAKGILQFDDAGKVTAVVSDFSEGAAYITGTHWIKEIGINQITVRMNALDTGGRDWTGRDFTAVIIAI